MTGKGRNEGFRCFRLASCAAVSAMRASRRVVGSAASTFASNQTESPLKFVSAFVMSEP